MYKGFNLELNNDLDFKKFLLENYYEYGNAIYNAKKQDAIKELNKYIGKDGSLDCTALQHDWFPEIKSNIFISHSHADGELAVSLAGWLDKEFGLESFIDSYVWGYCNDLLKDIDNRYCKHSDGKTYDYDKRNDSTSHVHIMLSTALNQMINKTECILFINTDKSILNTKNAISDGSGDKTRSPWIYSELVMTKLIKENLPNRFKSKKVELSESYNKSVNSANDSAILKPTYDVDLKHLILLSEKQLRDLSLKCKQEPYYKATDVLDKLYEITHVIDKRRLQTIYD